jgi:hypothetical protein
MSEIKQNISVGELTKLIVCVLVILAAMILGSMKSISSEATVGLITACLGYVFGNGHGILSANRANCKEVGRK